MHDHSNGKFQIRCLTIPQRYLSCASTPAQTNNNAMQAIHTDFMTSELRLCTVCEGRTSKHLWAKAIPRNDGWRAATP
jgi:hypothetical protein